jgi:hypothetical protein
MNHYSFFLLLESDKSRGMYSGNSDVNNGR